MGTKDSKQHSGTDQTGESSKLVTRKTQRPPILDPLFGYSRLWQHTQYKALDLLLMRS
jgi:hypothetical protein